MALKQLKFGRLRSTLFLALLSSVLLVNRGPIIESRAASIQESSLPALVLDETAAAADQAVGSSNSDKGDSAATTSQPTPAQNPDANVASEGNKESKLIPYETKPALEAAAAGTASNETQTATNKPPKDESLPPSAAAGSSETSTASTETNTSQSELSTQNSKSSDDAAAPPSSEKDINVLLANKDDAENDLASPSTPNSASLEPKTAIVVMTNEEKKTPTSDLDSPVDTINKQDSVESNGNRFHYALGNPQTDKAAESDLKPTESQHDHKPTVVGVTSVPEPQTTVSPSPADNKGPVGSSERPTTEGPQKPDENLGQEAAKRAEQSSEAPVVKATGTDDSLEAKKVEYADEKTKSIAVESVTVRSEEPAKKEKPAAASTTEGSKAKPEDVETASQQTTAAPDVLKAETPTSSSSSTESKPKQVEVEKKEKESPSKTASTSPIESQKPSVVEKVAESKPAPAGSSSSHDGASVLSTALGTALGAAVNPILTSIGQKSSSTTTTTTTTTTTKPITTSTTTRKSATDRWDRWNPSPPTTSTSTSTAPTRRRPILPSIRRRFRPYNRLNPFPWGGADSYIPVGSEPDYQGGEPSSSSIRPPADGRWSSTKSPKSDASGSSSIKPSTAPSDDEKIEYDDLPTTTNRRKGDKNGNRRRHHHHDHHNKPPSSSAPGEGPLTGRRRHHNHHHHHNHHSHNPREREERPSFGSPFELGPFGHNEPRPPMPGFGLFNTGSTGSGFDLLNPFSGWLDDLGVGASRPRPPVRGSNQPVSPVRPSTEGHRQPVEGEFNDHEEHHHHHHQPGRGQPGREHHEHHGHYDHDHDHHHHHDCHDQDYNHDHNHREPYRPLNHRERDREPVRPTGGDYDAYGSRPRPVRPYGRREQASGPDASAASGESSAPSLLYGSRIAGSEPLGQAGPRIRVSSIFSPFDSLFGALNDELFGLRSSFIDTPLMGARGNKPTLDSPPHTFDAVVTSPKISMPGAANPADGEAAAPVSADDKAEAIEGSRESNSFGVQMKRTRAFG